MDGDNMRACATVDVGGLDGPERQVRPLLRQFGLHPRALSLSFGWKTKPKPPKACPRKKIPITNLTCVHMRASNLGRFFGLS